MLMLVVCACARDSHGRRRELSDASVDASSTTAPLPDASADAAARSRWDAVVGSMSLQRISSIPDLVQYGVVSRRNNGDILVGGATESTAVLFRSADEGASFSKVCDVGPGGDGDPAMGIADVGGKIFVTTNASDELYESDGDSCSSLGAQSFSIRASRLLSLDSRLYALGRWGIFWTEDEGQQWTQIDVLNPWNDRPSAVASSDRYVVAACCSGGPGAGFTPRLDVVEDGKTMAATYLLAEGDHVTESPRVVMETEPGTLLLVGIIGPAWQVAPPSAPMFLGR